MKQIHQFVENIVPGDAISNECLQIQRYLSDEGYKSHIYTRFTELRNDFIHDVMAPLPEDAGFIIHHSTYTPILEYQVNRPNKKMLIYHNITPAAFFKTYDYRLFKIFREAERQNHLLENVEFDGLIGDSQYNLSTIKKYTSGSFENVTPPFLSLQFPEAKIQATSKLKDKKFTILFVGRIAPNKKQEDIIKVFEYYSKFLNPNAQLYLFGNYNFVDPYYNQLANYIKQRKIQNVYIRSNISVAELAETYQNADIFLSMSEHEGFCIPILEAIHFDLPVLAYHIPAISELIDETYLFKKKDYIEIGNRLFELEKNKKLRNQMIKNQKKILKKFTEEKVKKHFLSIISHVFPS